LNKMDFKSLKSKQRNLRVNFPESLALRVHRSLSWLDRSEQCREDIDSQFIFLWIAFNAAYAQDVEVLKHSESEAFSQFVSKLVDLDNTNELDKLIWSEFPKSIRLLLDNRYVFQPFWDFQNGKLTESEWKERFTKAKSAINNALSSKRTDVVIAIVLQRLYTLRNQTIHGGATWQSSTNRSQMRDGVSFLSQLVPIIINTMMENAGELWGSANYPVVK